MVERVDRPGTAVKFVYQCSHRGCEFEHRWRDVVQDHERGHVQKAPQQRQAGSQ